MRERQEEAGRLNQELEDTNRGVVALYAELDTKAEQLRRASELKLRFLSNMSHEFRTPLNSILALARLLLERADGDLNTEQERQVTYIQRSANSLLELVNDLLDIANVEAGKVDVKPTDFTVADVFGALRGALKPLQLNSDVNLVFEDAAGIPPLYADEGKVAQILRNFISSAMKFTEQGEVCVCAAYDEERQIIEIAVRDTGIGIAPEDHDHIFEEFTQLDGHHQKSVKGTGLGLPLSRKLAELLGGEVRLESAFGKGATFTLILPANVSLQGPPSYERRQLLIIDDEEASRYILRQMVDASIVDIAEAASGTEGFRLAQQLRPDLIVLDLQMPDLDGFEVLRLLQADPATHSIPVVVSTSLHLDGSLKAWLSCAAAFLSTNNLSREAVSSALNAALKTGTSTS